MKTDVKMVKYNLTNIEKDELNKIGNTIDIMGEKVELESMFGNKRVTELRKSLLDKKYLRRTKTKDNITFITLSKNGWNWYYAKG